MLPHAFGEEGAAVHHDNGLTTPCPTPLSLNLNIKAEEGGRRAMGDDGGTDERRPLVVAVDLDEVR